MNDSWRNEGPLDRIEQQAAAWVLRRDRGLSAAEQDEFSAWLAADPRHGAQLARHRRHWQRLDRLGQWLPEHGDQPNPDLLAPPRRGRLRAVLPVSLTLVAAAAILITLTIWRPAETITPAPAPAITATPPASPIGSRILDDGTLVELNRGTDITAQFSAAERRVRLDRGEAHFFVTHDPARPFIVSAGGIDVRAVGTAFNVRVDSAAVEVLVTEGTVQVRSGVESVRQATRGDAVLAGGPRPGDPGLPMSSSPPPDTAILTARQRAVVAVSGQAGPPQIATLTPGEIERVLAWQRRLLDFTAAPLTEIVAEFNRRNATQLVLLDPELAAVRISASFRSDNIAGFVHLLEAGFGVRTERRGEAEIVLRKSR